MSKEVGEGILDKQIQQKDGDKETGERQEEVKGKPDEIKASKVSRVRKAEVPSSVPKIGQSSHSRFSRENHNRHRSERLIDRYLVKSEKEEAMKYLEKLRLLQKINQKYAKERQAKEEEERKRQEEEKRKEIEERREKYKDLDHYKALLRIMKFIQKKGKYSKCLNLLKELLTENIDFFCQNTLLNTFDTLVKQECRSDNEEDRQILQDLYSMFCQYAFMEQDQFSQSQLMMLENYIIPIHIEGQFFTDDSYQFNQAAKALENVFDDLEIYEEEQEKYEHDFNNKNKVYEYLKPTEEGAQNEMGIVENEWIYTDVQDFELFNSFIKRKYFFNALKTLFPLYKNAWARGTIKRLLQKIYKEKEKLSEAEVDDLSDMMDAINSKTTSLGALSDSKIISNAAKGLNPVVDGRGTKVVMDGLGAWSQRQSNN